jgi:hypothetical protein
MENLPVIVQGDRHSAAEEGERLGEESAAVDEECFGGRERRVIRRMVAEHGIDE